MIVIVLVIVIDLLLLFGPRRTTRRGSLGRGSLASPLLFALAGCAASPPPPPPAARPAPTPPAETASGFLVPLDAPSVRVPPDVRDLEVLRSRPALQQVDLSGSEVHSLEPVSGLPLLRALVARGTWVDELPDGFVSLRQLDVRGTCLSRVEVERFRRTHPGCQVLFEDSLDWLEPLRAADRVLVRDFESRPVCQLAAAEVAGLIDLIGQALDAGSQVPAGNHCLCITDLEFAFMRGEERLGAVSFCHGGALRVPSWAGSFKVRQPHRGRLADLARIPKEMRGR